VNDRLRARRRDLAGGDGVGAGGRAGRVAPKSKLSGYRQKLSSSADVDAEETL
jgi:hypothetical protein